MRLHVRDSSHKPHEAQLKPHDVIKTAGESKRTQPINFNDTNIKHIKHVDISFFLRYYQPLPYTVVLLYTVVLHTTAFS